MRASTSAAYARGILGLMISPDEAPALRRQLQATIDHVGQQPGARTLRKALALVEGVGVFIVVSNTPRAAAALQLWLEDVHAHDREDALTMGSCRRRASASAAASSEATSWASSPRPRRASVMAKWARATSSPRTSPSRS
jgi:hypothetical protein